MQTRGIDHINPTPELLEDLGIKRNTFTMWINGKSDPNMLQVQIIAEKVLKCSVVELFPTNEDETQILEKYGLKSAS